MKSSSPSSGCLLLFNARMQKIEELQLDERREAEVRLTGGRSTGDAQAGELLKRLVLEGGRVVRWASAS